MPIFHLPDNFTIPDGEFRDAKEDQERLYRDEGGRQADRTYLDALGHMRWDVDYITLRMAGYSHEDAKRVVRIRIRAAWPTPLPNAEQLPAPPRPAPPPPNAPAPLPPRVDPLADPALYIRPYLALADIAQPELKRLNTRASCFALLQDALRRAGRDWAFIGKTRDMDGEGKYTPPGFLPREMTCIRPDGQSQLVTISAVSMDAAWYVPAMRQVKVIVNSGDGEVGGAGKPARLDSYNIPRIGEDGQVQYRWHNPPVDQGQI